jgi:hypothetical protein
VIMMTGSLLLLPSMFAVGALLFLPISFGMFRPLALLVLALVVPLSHEISFHLIFPSKILKLLSEKCLCARAP